MGRGVSSGGGQSSLGYLFGSGEAPKSTPTNSQVVQSEAQPINKEPSPKPVAAPPPSDAISKSPQVFRVSEQMVKTRATLSRYKLMHNSYNVL